jgi:hypothetical protein
VEDLSLEVVQAWEWWRVVLGCESEVGHEPACSDGGLVGALDEPCLGLLVEVGGVDTLVVDTGVVS